MLTFEALETAIRKAGLTPRGGFRCEPGDGIPDLPDGRTAATLVLCGNVGASLWPAFSGAPEYADGAGDPLNRWSERVVGALAAELGAAAHYPFGGPPYVPFLRWAKRAEPVDNSPLGMLIHPRYGLWHAYRGALAFAEAIDLPPAEFLPLPCESCAEQPCLQACPVGAFSGETYDVTACAGHIAAPAGVDCLSNACLARRACPVGREYLYAPAQAGFHMRAFLKSRQEGLDP